jgi:hypothetical protein
MTMRTVETTIDVTAAVGTGETLSCAVTVHLPDEMPSVAAALVGFPGGGYNRRYFDLRIDGHEGYSQAEFHTANGGVLIAIDHVGVGDSDVPTTPLDYSAVARGGQAAAAEVLDRLRSGTLAPGLPAITTSSVVAIGQSFGGFLLTIGQGNDPIYDGVGFLGWSGLQTVAPWPPDTDLMEMLTLEAGNGLTHPMTSTFHQPDVPEDIVLADMTKLPGTVGSTSAWSTLTSPGGPALVDERNPLLPGVVAAEAARLDVPVFVGAGVIDVVADVRLEATAYSSSPLVTLAEVPQMSHMHNFASTRRQLWELLARWQESITAAR